MFEDNVKPDILEDEDRKTQWLVPTHLFLPKPQEEILIHTKLELLELTLRTSLASLIFSSLLPPFLFLFQLPAIQFLWH